MSQPIIKIDNLSKLYRLGEVGTGTLSHDLNRWWKTKVLRREDPYSIVGAINDRTQAAQKGEHVWALRDINLELQEGDVLGIIGKNGAGKSTLLKLLSQITSPTTGRIRARGRMASLLEVGTGFHPEMTGRENIYMNGTIMGMRKREITSKLDEIVDFSGVAKYLDTPVKRYSSGMTVRLGFAIAAHLEPEILVVDEVLAVGDAEFQKKAVGKMQDVSKSHGRTVLFVSHNMAAVKTLCKKGMVLVNGCQRFEGNITDAIDFYQDNNALVTAENNHWEFGNNAENDNIRVTSIKISPLNGTTMDIGSGVQIEIIFFNKIKDITEDLTFEIVNKDDVLVFHHGFVFAKNRNSKLGEHKITAAIPPHLLNANIYSMNLIFGQSQRYVLFRQDRICAFEIENIPMENNMTILPGVVRPMIDYSLECHDSSTTNSSLRIEDRRTEPPIKVDGFEPRATPDSCGTKLPSKQIKKNTHALPKIIDLPKILDPRGNLSFVESEQHIPFAIKRAYWIYDVPGGEIRGSHAFKQSQEFIIALSGSFEVVLNDGLQEKSFFLNRSFYGLYVPEMYWRTIKSFSTNALALVLASTSFDQEDYIRDFHQFNKAKENV